MTPLTNSLTVQILTSKLQSIGGAEKVECLIQLSNYFISSGEIKIAMGYALQAADAAAFELRSAEYSAETTVQIGKVYLAQMQYELADQNFAQAQANFQKCHSQAGQARVEFLRGKSFWTRNLPESAVSHLESAARIFEELGDRQNLGDCLSMLGTINYTLKDFGAALGYLLAAANSLEMQHPDSIVIELLIKIGDVLLDLNRFEDALPYYQDAYRLATVKKDRFLQNDSLFGLGRQQFYLGKFADAVRIFERSLQLSSELSDRMTEKHVMNYLVSARSEIDTLKERDERAKLAALLLNQPEMRLAAA